jgi:hypothetical protein
MKKGDIVILRNGFIAYVLKGGTTVTTVYYNESLKKFYKQQKVSPVTLVPALKVDMHPKLIEMYDSEFSESVKLKKGDFVEFDFEDEQHIGIVQKGGVTATIFFFASDGNEVEVRGSSCGFKKIDKPLIVKDEPTSMDDWSVKSFKENKEMSEVTIAFTAIVTYKGKDAFHVESIGYGGSMSSHNCTSKDSTNYYKLFNTDLEEWTNKFNLKDKDSEVDEFWVLWFSRSRNHGISAKEAFRRYNVD